MDVLILDPDFALRLIAARRESRRDRFDEVWVGTYVMAPSADNHRQNLAARLVAAFQTALGFDSPAQVCAGVDVSDRDEGWTYNYRCPDVAVFLPGTAARDRGAFWEGGSDFAVEIASPHDRSREKLTFYARVGMRELLLVDRDPWALELYALHEGTLASAGRTTLAQPAVLSSAVLPVAFRLVEGPARPRVEVARLDGAQRWRA